MTGRLAVHVVPRARRTEFAGLHGQALKIRIAAPPTDGAANAELVRYVADRLGVPRRSVDIAAGMAARDKVLAVEGLSAETIRARLTDASRA